MKGFTLIELLVVMAITVVMTGLMIQNFSRSRVDLGQTAVLVQDAIREAQSLALAGALYRGSYRCGYGIHFTENSYTIYAARASDEIDCTTIDRNFGDGDEVVRTGHLSNTTLRIVPAPDIFFEPPRPTTYINNSALAGEADIRIVRGDATCPSADCRTINVTTSGLITVQ